MLIIFSQLNFVSHVTLMCCVSMDEFDCLNSDYVEVELLSPFEALSNWFCALDISEP
jgi:hypothetical protein